MLSCAYCLAAMMMHEPLNVTVYFAEPVGRLGQSEQVLFVAEADGSSSPAERATHSW